MAALWFPISRAQSPVRPISAVRSYEANGVVSVACVQAACWHAWRPVRPWAGTAPQQAEQFMGCSSGADYRHASCKCTACVALLCSLAPGPAHGPGYGFDFQEMAARRRWPACACLKRVRVRTHLRALLALSRASTGVGMLHRQAYGLRGVSQKVSGAICRMPAPCAAIPTD